MPLFAQDEKVIFTVRKHWFVIFTHAFVLGLLSFVPVLLVSVIDASNVPTTIEITKISNVQIKTFFYSLWLLFLWIGFFIEWTDYYLDLWHITSKRIIDVEQKGFFNREVSSIHFDRVQDVTIEIRGIIPTLLDFGDIKIQTAGQDSGNFILRAARHPKQAKDMIVETHNRVTHIKS